MTVSTQVQHSGQSHPAPLIVGQRVRIKPGGPFDGYAGQVGTVSAIYEDPNALSLFVLLGPLYVVSIRPGEDTLNYVHELEVVPDGD